MKFRPRADFRGGRTCREEAGKILLCLLHGLDCPDFPRLPCLECVPPKKHSLTCSLRCPRGLPAVGGKTTVNHFQIRECGSPRANAAG